MRVKLSREIAAEFAARAVVGVLFAVLSMNLLNDFVHTRRVTGLLLLASESLVMVLVVFRRRARLVDRSVAAAAITGLSVMGPPLFRAASVPPLVPDALTAVVSAVGLVVVIAGKLTLGRSFGIVPANRGVVIGGPYNLVRHPIYAGYLVTHLAFIAANPSARNVIIALCADTALVVRALLEERVLTADEQYRSYCTRVAWHLVPGLF